MKRIIFITLALLGVSVLRAQSISGRLTDETNQPVSFANVVLLSLPDSAFVAGGTSDPKGKFKLEGLKADNYLLQLSFVGYVTQLLRLDNVDRAIDLGEVRMEDESVLLQGVTVTGSSVSRRIDRQIVLPTEKQVRASTSGYELLSHIQLPGLKVNSLQQSVSTLSGGNVQLRINDLEASVAQIQALRPDEVIRVEYIDNPGVRYADSGAEAVVNYVVRRARSGFSGGVSLMNAVTTGFGNDNIYLRGNYKLSEFGLNYSVSYRDYDDRKVDEEQTFFFTEDGSRRERNLTGIPTPFSYVDHNIELSYNLTKPEKYVINALFTENLYDNPHGDYGQHISETGKPDLYSYTLADYTYHSPSLDLYYKQFLPHEQYFALNAVGTYIGSDYSRRYTEADRAEAVTPSSAYAYGTDGSRYSLIGEGIYQKTFSRLTLTAGLRYMQAYTNNRYTGDVDNKAEMHSSSLYGYVQAQGEWKRLNYSLGMGLSRQAFDESEEGFTFYMFRPMLSLSYPVFPGAKLRYNFSCSPSIPGLSTLSDIRQQVTDLEVRRGNRNLNPYRSYNNRLQLSWGNRWVDFQLNGSHRYSKNPIMEQTECVGQPDGSYLFEYGYDNQKSFTRWNGELFANVNVVPDVLSISLYGGVNSYASRGWNYSHDYTAWYGGGSVSFSHKGFSAFGSIGSRYNSLYGESIDYGENNCQLHCSYTWKQLTVGAGMLYPFTPSGWSAGSKLLNKQVKKESWTYIKDNGNMLMFTLSWNFNSGRKHKAEKQSISNMDRDTGIAM